MTPRAARAAAACAALAATATLGAACGGSREPTPSPPLVTRDDRRPDPRDGDAPRRSHPASPDVARAEQLLAAGDAEAAQRILTAAVERDPDDARAWLDLGLALEATGDVDGAERAFHRAIRVDDRFAEAHNDLGLLLASRGDAAAAEQELRLAIRYGPELAEPRVNLAMLLEEQGRADEALGLYRAARRLDPGDPQVATNLGLLLVDEGRVEEARGVLSDALTLARDEPALLVSIANGLRRVARPAAALDAMTRAVSSWQGDVPPSVTAELALAQRAMGDRAAAEATLEALVAAHGGYATGHFLLGSLLAAREAWPEAAAHLERAADLDPGGPIGDRAARALEAVRDRQSAD